MANAFNVSMRVVNFEQELQRAVLEMEDIADDDIDQKMDRATQLLREVTPVDTGFARSRWVNRKNIILPGGVIENDAPYIVFLNQGSSRQAPAFFIERVLRTARLV